MKPAHILWPSISSLNIKIKQASTVIA